MLCYAENNFKSSVLRNYHCTPRYSFAELAVNGACLKTELNCLYSDVYREVRNGGDSSNF